MQAPGLGDDPDTCCACFFFASRDIEIGEWLTWHYGHFHGIFKEAFVSGDDDELHENEVSQVPTGFEEDNDSHDDANTAAALSLQLSKDANFARQLSKELNQPQSGYDQTAASLRSQLVKDQKLARKLAKELEQEVAAPAPPPPPAAAAASAAPATTAAAAAANAVAAAGKRSRPESANVEKPFIDKDLRLSSSDDQSESQKRQLVLASTASMRTKSKRQLSRKNVDVTPMGEAPTLATESVQKTSKISLCGMFNIDDTCFIAKASSSGCEFQKCVVKKRLKCSESGLITHYEVLVGNKQHLIGYQKAHDDFAQHSEWKRKRKESNMQNRSDEQERIRLESVAKYQRGDLTFVAEPSPDHGPAASHIFKDSYDEVDERVDVSSEADDERPAEKSHNELPISFSGLDNRNVPSEQQQEHQNEENCSESSDHEQLALLLSDEDEPLFRNESQMEAMELNTKKFELSTMSSAEIWDLLFMDTKIRGGTIGRTVLIKAKTLEPSVCHPWSGSKSFCTRKEEKKDQRQSFIQWADDRRVLKWLQKEIYFMVISKPRSYKCLVVTHADFPDTLVRAGLNNSLTLNALEATDDVMARVAHLACCSESRACLNQIFGPKNHRESINDQDLFNDQMWSDLAAQFVNNPNWDFSHINVPQLEYKKISLDGTEQTLSKIDATKCQRPGITGEICKDVFKSIQSDYHKLCTSTKSRTGCNGHPQMYSIVWNQYINGPTARNYFPRPAVTMYVFTLWNTAENNGSLPKYCLKTLSPEAAVRAGCSDSASTAATTPLALNITPRTPKGSGSGSGQSSLMSPNSAVGSVPSVDGLVSYLKTQSDRRLSIAEETLRLSIAEEALRRSDGDKMQKVVAPPPPEPDTDLVELIAKHNLEAYWKCVNVKLHVGKISDLAIISKKLLKQAVPISDFPAVVRYVHGTVSQRL